VKAAASKEITQVYNFLCDALGQPHDEFVCKAARRILNRGQWVACAPGSIRSKTLRGKIKS
jgi:hypothetical protein